MFTEQEIIEFAKETIDIEINSLNLMRESLNTSFFEAVKTILNCQGAVVISGMGKSGLVGKKIAATMTSTGTKAIFLHPAEGIHGDLGIVDKKDVLILLSKSGENPELNEIIPFFKSNGNTIISIVTNNESTLAKNSDIVLHAPIEKEACPNNLAPTSSTTVTLALGDAIAVALVKIKDFTKEDFAKYHPGGALGKRLLLQVKDIMHKENLPSTSIGSSMLDALYDMTSGRLGLTVVMDNENKVIGIITDGDLRRMLEKNIDIHKVNVEDVMYKFKRISSQKPKSINQNELAVKGLKIMEEFEITSLLVTDNNDRLRGILHIHDILNVGITLD